MLTLRAVENAVRLGYRRPGLVLDEVIDRLVEFRFTAGFRTAQQQLAMEHRVEPFYAVSAARENPQLFRQWYEKEKPDVILTLYHVVRRWLDEMKIQAPQNVGLIQMEWRSDHPDWAGMHQHNDIVGEAAVEMVISMIHRDETGVPLFPRATLLGSTWVDGKTIRLRRRERGFVSRSA